MFDSLNTEELEFVKAIETFKAKTGKMFPSWTDVLRILMELGYKKTAARKPRAPAEAPQALDSVATETTAQAR